MKNKGIALFFSLVIILILFLLGRAAFMRAMSANDAYMRFENSLRAFWIAEAGLNRALYKISLDNLTNATEQFGGGNFSYNFTQVDASNCTVKVRVNFRNATRGITARVRRVGPNIPFGNALYCAGELFLGNGNWRIDGNVTHAFAFRQSGTPGTINGTRIQDPSISPLFSLNFDYLKAISISQGNYYNSSRLNGPFPTSFWYNQTAQIPNIVYLEGDLVLTGNAKVGGFIITKGEVIYNETDYNSYDYNTSLAGTVDVYGVIYTPGKFTMKGTAEIVGGVFSGSNATLSGNPNIRYNATYMSVVRDIMNRSFINQTLWREDFNPYKLQF